MLAVRGVRPQRRRQRPQARLELGEPRDPVAVDVEHEHAVGAHEAVVGLRPGREQGPDAVVVPRVLEEPLAADRVLAGAAAGRALRAPARPVGVGAPHAEHAEPLVREPGRGPDARLGRRTRAAVAVMAGEVTARGRDRRGRPRGPAAGRARPGRCAPSAASPESMSFQAIDRLTDSRSATASIRSRRPCRPSIASTGFPCVDTCGILRVIASMHIAGDAPGQSRGADMSTATANVSMTSTRGWTAVTLRPRFAGDGRLRLPAERAGPRRATDLGASGRRHRRLRRRRVRPVRAGGERAAPRRGVRAGRPDGPEDRRRRGTRSTGCSTSRTSSPRTRSR